MKTILGQQAIENLNRFKKHCLEEEFNRLEKGVKEFDSLLTGSGFDAIQAKQKLTAIKEMNFETFKAVMLAYFGKTFNELQNV